MEEEITKDQLFVYEFVHTGSLAIYNAKAENYDDVRLDAYLFFMTNILKNNVYEKNDDDVCTNSPDWSGQTISLDYYTRSCDPILFKYVIKRDSLDNYNYNPDNYNIMHRSLLNFRCEDNNMTKFIAECLILPELNTIGIFNNMTIDKAIITKNYKLKAFSLDANTFERALNNIKELYTFLEDDPLFSSSINIVYANQERNIKYLDTTKLKITYITKLVIKDGTKICLFGDIHGSIHSVLRSILRLMEFGFINSDFILNDDFKIIFLGDLVDRSIYGIEVLYFIMKLKLLNPEKVYIIRGNHEECCTSTRYNLHEEFKKLDEIRYAEIYALYCRTWLYLPVAIFLTDNNKKEYTQLCHGGLYGDITTIRAFLRSEKDFEVFATIGEGSSRHDENSDYYNSIITDFQWSDFIGMNLEKEILLENMRSHKYGIVDETSGRKQYHYNEAMMYIRNSPIRNVIRGHQDMFDNTKLLCMNDTNDLLKIENYIMPEKIKSIDKVSSFTIPLLSKASNAVEYHKEYNFAPVFTLTTGIPSRFTDSDGFSILHFGNNDISDPRPKFISSFSSSSSSSSSYGGYKKYKQKYLDLKKLKK